jgi:hypothetical protein
MSEETVEPCAWCDKPAACYMLGFIECDNHGCVMSCAVIHENHWNETQRAIRSHIVEKQREAFEAGQASVDLASGDFGNCGCDLSYPHDAFEDWLKQQEAKK